MASPGWCSKPSSRCRLTCTGFWRWIVVECATAPSPASASSEWSMNTLACIHGWWRRIVSDSAHKVVLAIFAHPDDESLACGGTLARLSDAGVRVVLICGSRGESGSVSDPALVPDGDLGRVRTRELRDAADILGISDVIVMDHPDGDLRWDSVPEFHEEIVTAIEKYRPDAVI